MSHILRNGSNLFTVGDNVFRVRDRKKFLYEQYVSLVQAYAIKYDPVVANNRLFVTFYASGELKVYNATTFAFIATVTGMGSASDLDILPDGSKIFVCDRTGGRLFIIDGTTLTITTTITVGITEGVAIDNINNKYYLCLGTASVIGVYNLTTNAPITTIIGQAGRCMAIDESRGLVYFNVPNEGKVKVMDTNTYDILYEISGFSADNYQIEVDPVAENCRVGIARLSPLGMEFIDTKVMTKSLRIQGINSVGLVFDRIAANNRILTTAFDTSTLSGLIETYN